jgi:hypothetical protein
LQALSAGVDVRRLDVAMHEAGGMSFFQRRRYAKQKVNGSLRGDRTIFLDQCLKIEAVQKFHHIIKRSIFRTSEVVNVYGVRRS